MLDMYLSPHVNTLYSQIRNRALVQVSSIYIMHLLYLLYLVLLSFSFRSAQKHAYRKPRNSLSEHHIRTIYFLPMSTWAKAWCCEPAVSMLPMYVNASRVPYGEVIGHTCRSWQSWWVQRGLYGRNWELINSQNIPQQVCLIWDSLFCIWEKETRREETLSDPIPVRRKYCTGNIALW